MVKGYLHNADQEVEIKRTSFPFLIFDFFRFRFPTFSNRYTVALTCTFSRIYGKRYF